MHAVYCFLARLTRDRMSHDSCGMTQGTTLQPRPPRARSLSIAFPRGQALIVHHYPCAVHAVAWAMHAPAKGRCLPHTPRRTEQTRERTARPSPPRPQHQLLDIGMELQTNGLYSDSRDAMSGRNSTARRWQATVCAQFVGVPPPCAVSTFGGRTNIA